jgi:CBS domain containing-hemolysin-like protein
MKHPLTSSPAPAVASLRWLAASLLLQAPSVAHASLLHGETLDAAATVIAWIVICVVPIVVIVLFWLVHVMPEKIAEKRHHPQKEAITTLCLLSLVFGGLLWPIAWLWAYTKPIGYRMAYGTDKHDDYYVDMTDKAKEGGLLEPELDHLRAELDAMAAKGTLPPKLKALRADLAMLQAKPPAAETKVETA